MCDTPSHGSDHLWLIWKESIQNCRCYRADTAGGTDGRTDGRTDRRTDGVKPIYPPTTSLFGGYNYNMLLHILLQGLRQNPKHGLNSRQISHTLPLLANNGGAYCENWGKTDCIIMALHCTCTKKKKVHSKFFQEKAKIPCHQSEPQPS